MSGTAGYEELRLRQVMAMADPDRLRLLALVITDASGQPTASLLAGRDGDVDGVRGHLEAMADAALVARVAGPGGETGYRPTPDALARFGGAAIASPTVRHPEPVDPSDHARLLARITAELARDHAQVLAPETVARFVADSYDLLAARASVRNQLPALTARFAADRLSALVAPVDDGDPASVDAAGRSLDVLFVCVHNAGRSQIAAAVLRAAAGDRVRVRTAGTVPWSRIDPGVRSELARRDIDRLTEMPRPLTDEVIRASRVVVTLGCGDVCPVVPGRRYLDWPIENPAGRSVEEISRIVDDITARVHDLLTDLLPRSG
ncbi:low molecular weight phosphatase family protein [Isoptericola croceus]|uniref:low molecular weight phosphatase family protein n=1 Tax=Isoptericola croceus TaxID=3031406 RepID=UPI0023F66037|nr:low molecular weight phosphatase family protein [Isoptericola croceus]